MISGFLEGQKKNTGKQIDNDYPHSFLFCPHMESDFDLVPRGNMYGGDGGVQGIEVERNRMVGVLGPGPTKIGYYSV